MPGTTGGLHPDWNRVPDYPVKRPHPPLFQRQAAEERQQPCPCCVHNWNPIPAEGTVPPAFPSPSGHLPCARGPHHMPGPSSPEERSLPPAALRNDRPCGPCVLPGQHSIRFPAWILDVPGDILPPTPAIRPAGGTAPSVLHSPRRDNVAGVPAPRNSSPEPPAS